MTSLASNYADTRAGRMYLPDWDKKICKALHKVGEWEPDVADAIEEYSRPDWTFLDLGAHVGFFSLLAEKHNRKVISVEPQPRVFDVLRRNVSGECHNVAITDRDGLARMCMAEPNTGSSWVVRGEKEGTVLVSCATLDSILQGRRPEFIKIDIEGCEDQALRSSPEILEQAKVIITEYSASQLRRSSGVSGRDYYDLLINAGFTVCTLKGEPTDFTQLPTGTYTNLLCLNVRNLRRK